MKNYLDKRKRCEMANGNGMTTSERALFLVNSSVGDLISAMPHYNVSNAEDVEVIREGLRICERRGEKTKAGHLRRKLAKMEKENQHASV